MRRPLPLLALLPLLPGLALLLPGCGESSGFDLEEEQEIYYVSQIVVSTEKHPPGEARAIARQIREQIRSGTPFADVARARSEDDSAVDGGFVGHIAADDVAAARNTSLHGAIQALDPGSIGGPIRTPLGYHVVKRHVFAEGRRLEEENRISAFGFHIPFKEMDPSAARTQEEAMALGRQIVDDLRAGRTTMADAGARYAVPVPGVPPGPAAISAAKFGAGKFAYEFLKPLKAWEIADPFVSNTGVSIVQRLPFFRSVVRHILVRYSSSLGAEISLRRTRDEARQLAEKILAMARPEKATWAALVNRYSEDVFTAGDMGSLGAISAEDVAPSLVQTILKTEAGRIAPVVVETPQGFHVVWRVN
jgi:hypothetical protein